MSLFDHFSFEIELYFNKNSTCQIMSRISANQYPAPGRLQVQDSLPWRYLFGNEMFFI